MEAAVLLKLGLPKSVYSLFPVYSHVSQGLPCQGWASRLKVVSFVSNESLFYVFICVGVHMRVPQQTLEIRGEVLFFHH